MDTILKVKDLKVSYHTYAGEVQAVRGVSFQVNKGEVLAIVGESGCGKSVTARSIMGLIPIPPGEIKEGSQIIYSGENILAQPESKWQTYRGAQCSMIFQDALTSLNPTMTIGNQITENITNHFPVSKTDAKNRAAEMLAMVGISDAALYMRKYPHELSGGMRQRVMIAIALAGNPKILIADEPTTALDVTIQAQIIDLLKKLQLELGMTIILITHDLGVVAAIANRVAVMYSGKVVEEGSLRDIFYKRKHPYTWALLNAAPNLELKHKQELTTIEGAPPDLSQLPKGCLFAQRCPHRMNICLEAEPPEYVPGEGHRVSCWLYHPDCAYTDTGCFNGGKIV